LWFTWYFTKVSEDCGELGIYTFLVFTVKIGGSTTLGDARGLSSSNTKCRFLDEHVKRDALWHSWLFRIVEYSLSCSSDRI
jgi:hypothetical protein